MKPSFDEDLKEFNDDLRIQSLHKEALKKRIIHTEIEQVQKRPSRKKIWLPVVAALAILLLCSPLYSPTMATLAAKILPLKIQSSLSEDDLLNTITESLKAEGYEYDGVGIRYNPFTIEIPLQRNQGDSSEVKKAISLHMTQLLYDVGIDDYKLKISESATPDIVSEKEQEELKQTSELLDKAYIIIQATLKDYGYEELAIQISLGRDGSPDARLLTLNFPDDIPETDVILQTIKKQLVLKEIGIHNIEVDYYNAEHRAQDSRWSQIASDIHNSLVGKSMYKVTGMSYIVKKGQSNVWLKTSWTEKPNDAMITEIQQAIETYLSSPEVQNSIANDAYSIQYVMKNKDVIFEMKSPKP